MALARLSALRAQIAPITAITLFGIALAMSYPLFALMLERAGTSGAAIGLNAMAAALGMVTAAPLMPTMLRRAGMGRSMIGAALALGAMFLMIPLIEDYWLLTGLRLAYGFAATILFFASEFWIVAAAPEASRGRIIAVYALCVSGGFALGPALLKLTGLTGSLPFVAACAVMLAGLIPISWGLATAPATDDGETASPLAALAMFVAAPTVVFGVTLFGTIEFGAMALVAVWGVRSGLAEADAALLLSVFALGSMALQMPLGWAADRFDRRALLIGIAACCIVAPLGMVLTAPSFPALAAFSAFWGATSVGLYSIALTEMGARYKGNRLAVANAAVVLAYGFGALAAPLTFGAAMDALPPDGLLVGAAAVAAAYLTLALGRALWLRRRAGMRREMP
ncbi:MAG TPA: MFS transporter [Thermohalobaculum sp.]|nr:MFS transporter [Thermohalobaculum sp.]